MKRARNASQQIRGLSNPYVLLLLRGVWNPETEALTVLGVNCAPVLDDRATNYPTATGAFSGHGETFLTEAVKGLQGVVGCSA